MAQSITPGKWHWHDTFGRKDGTGEPIPATDMHPAKVGNVSPFSFAVTDEHGFAVAHCTGSLVTMSSERSEANARAIANVPEMIAVIGDLLKWAEQMGGWEAPCWERARKLHGGGRQRPLSDHEGPARSLVIRTSKGDDIEVLPEDAPGLFDEWEEWAEAQEKCTATAEDWTKVLGAADGYLSSLPLGSTGMDETAEDVRAIR